MVFSSEDQLIMVARLYFLDGVSQAKIGELGGKPGGKLYCVPTDWGTEAMSFSRSTCQWSGRPQVAPRPRRRAQPGDGNTGEAMDEDAMIRDIYQTVQHLETLIAEARRQQIEVTIDVLHTHILDACAPPETTLSVRFRKHLVLSRAAGGGR